MRAPLTTRRSGDECDLTVQIAHRTSPARVNRRNWNVFILLRPEAEGQGNSLNPYPRRSLDNSSNTLASSMVDGTVYSSLSAICRMVLRRILPERVFGSAATTVTSRNVA